MGDDDLTRLREEVARLTRERDAAGKEAHDWQKAWQKTEAVYGQLLVENAKMRADIASQNAAINGLVEVSEGQAEGLRRLRAAIAPTEANVEALARVIFEADHIHSDGGHGRWDRLADDYLELLRVDARATLAAINERAKL